MSDKLKEYARQSMAELLKTWPVEERLKGVSAEEMVRALPPETLEALARLLKANGRTAEPDAAGDGPRE